MLSISERLAAEGRTMALIPFLQDKKLLQIKLRDYPGMEGIGMMDFIFSNSVKNNAPPKSQTQNPSQNQNVNASSNEQSNINSAPRQIPNQSSRTNTPMPSSIKKNKPAKTKPKM